MKCNGINYNQPKASLCSFAKKGDNQNNRRKELSPYDGMKKLGLAGGVLALATHGFAYGVVKSSLAGFKDRKYSEAAEVLKGYQERFSKVADMSKTTCSKFIKGTLKDIANPKAISRSVVKGIAIGAVVGWFCDSARRYATTMDYKRE